MEPSIATSPRRTLAWRFPLVMALVMAALTLAGFAPTYYLAGLTAAEPLPLAIHVHGALCTAWTLLLVLQTALVASRHTPVHRQAGLAALVLVPAIFASGVLVALRYQTRVHTPATAGTLADPYAFLAFPLVAITLFTLFAVAGLASRHRPGTHQRLMLLATISLLLPALARVVRQVTAAVPGPIGALILSNLLIAALIVHDLRTDRRLHPATLWGGGLLILSEPGRVLLAFSPGWQSLARALMG